MYDVGEAVPLRFETRTNGVPADADAVTLTVTLPDGTTATPTVANPETGVYAVDYPATAAGRHTVRWTATGSAYTDVFNVRDQASLALISLAALKGQVNMDSTTDDRELRTVIGAATGVIERHLRQVVARRAVSELVRASRPVWAVALRKTPVINLSAVASLDGLATWDVDDLAVDAETGIVTVLRGPALCGQLRFNFTAGMAVVPGHILEAAEIIAAHLWETQRMGLTRDPRAAVDEYLTPSGQGYALPNRAIELLGGRPPVLA